jgi:hypothetical protein
MNIKLSNSSLAALLAVGVLTLSGCVPRAAYTGSGMGESLAETKASQTLNPDASLNADPVVGLDGQSADNAINGYVKSFKSPTPLAPISTISIGGGATGGSR